MQLSDTEGGFVLTCNAAYFELIKAALPRYIAEHLCLKSEDLAKDKNGAVERVSLKVALKNGRKCCMINLYYTTSKILINGALSERLIQDHLPEIHSSIKTQLMRYGIRLSTLNQHLRDSLIKATQKKPKTTKQRKTPSQRMLQNSAQNITETRDSIAAQLLTDEPYQHDTSDQGDHAYICPVCQEVVEQESIYCDVCQLWFHSACENVSTHDMMNMADSNDAYTCSLCRSANAEMVNMNTPHDAQLEIRSGGDTVDNALDYIHPLSPNVVAMAVTPPVDVACSVPISGALSLTCAHNQFLTSQLHSTPKTPDIPTTTNPITSAPDGSPPASNAAPASIAPEQQQHQGTKQKQKRDSNRIGTSTDKNDMEKKLKMWEKELKKRELEVEHSERKMAAQTALISSLEVRIKDLEHSNRLLKLQSSNSGIQPQNLDAYTQSGLPQNGVSNGRSHTQCCSHTHAAPPEHADMQAIKLSLQRLEMEQIRQRLDLHSDLISRFNNPQPIIQPPPHGLPPAMPPPHIMRPSLIPNASYMHYNQHQYRDSWHPQAGPPTRTGPAHPDFAPGQPTHDERPQNNNQNRFHSDSHKPPPPPRCLIVKE